MGMRLSLYALVRRPAGCAGRRTNRYSRNFLRTHYIFHYTVSVAKLRNCFKLIRAQMHGRRPHRKERGSGRGKSRRGVPKPHSALIPRKLRGVKALAESSLVHFQMVAANGNKRSCQ